MTALKRNPPADMLSFGSSSAVAKGSLSLTSILAILLSIIAPTLNVMLIGHNNINSYLLLNV